MVKIIKKKNGVMISNNDVVTLFPLNALYTHVDANSSSIELRLKASRRNILSFDYSALEEPVSSDIDDAQMKISELLS